MGTSGKTVAERIRILLVDDLADVRDALGELLRQAGFDVVSLDGGPAALAELEQRRADILLTDLNMPEMTGWDLVRAVRARHATTARGLPMCVGIYSAATSGFTREQLARAEIDFVISKLADPDGIVEAVERAHAWSEVR